MPKDCPSRNPGLSLGYRLRLSIVVVVVVVVASSSSSWSLSSSQPPLACSAPSRSQRAAGRRARDGTSACIIIVGPPPAMPSSPQQPQPQRDQQQQQQHVPTNGSTTRQLSDALHDLEGIARELRRSLRMLWTSWPAVDAASNISAATHQQQQGIQSSESVCNRVRAGSSSLGSSSLGALRAMQQTLFNESLMARKQRHDAVDAHLRRQEEQEKRRRALERRERREKRKRRQQQQQQQEQHQKGNDDQEDEDEDDDDDDDGVCDIGVGVGGVSGVDNDDDEQEEEEDHRDEKGKAPQDQGSSSDQDDQRRGTRTDGAEAEADKLRRRRSKSSTGHSSGQDSQGPQVDPSDPFNLRSGSQAKAKEGTRRQHQHQQEPASRHTSKSAKRSNKEVDDELPAFAVILVNLRKRRFSGYLVESLAELSPLRLRKFVHENTRGLVSSHSMCPDDELDG